jgi:DNA-binding transcriptional ArsR family regulator
MARQALYTRQDSMQPNGRKNIGARTKHIDASPAANAPDFTWPSQASLDQARDANRRLRGRSAQVRHAFILRRPSDPTPPMTRMLRGGRSGVVRLKLYLSLLWFAGKAPYEVSYPYSAWATLLNLPDPERNGKRRVADAFAWLADKRFVRVERTLGHPPRVFVRMDDGSGRVYKPPGELASRKGASKQDIISNLYVKLPQETWTQGWLAAFSGPALVMHLALLAESGGKRTEELWFSPSSAADRFDLSEDTRSRGLSDLQELGLITKLRRPVTRDGRPGDAWSERRFRNVYSLVPQRIAEHPWSLPASQGLEAVWADL